MINNQDELAHGTGEIFEPEEAEEDAMQQALKDCCPHPVKDTTINLSTLMMHCYACGEEINLRTFVEPILRKTA